MNDAVFASSAKLIADAIGELAAALRANIRQRPGPLLPEQEAAHGMPFPTNSAKLAPAPFPKQLDALFPPPFPPESPAVPMRKPFAMVAIENDYTRSHSIYRCGRCGRELLRCVMGVGRLADELIRVHTTACPNQPEDVS